jgi:signal transduction histidine kinase
MPAKLRHPLIGCALGALLALAAAGAEYLLRAAVPHLMAREFLTYLTIVMVALLWGLLAALVSSLVSNLATALAVMHVDGLWSVSHRVEVVDLIVLVVSACLLGVISSVSEGRRRELALQQQQRLAWEAERAQAAEQLAQLRADFVATVSHELRTPLTAIIGYSELLEVRWDRVSESERREHLRRIVAAANRQLGLVQDLLLLSRLESGPMHIALSAVDLQEQTVLAAREVRANYRDARIDLMGVPGLMVLADPERLVQVLVNLLDNAAKYSPEGRPILVNWDQDGPVVALWVQDHGTGVPEQSRDLLFTRFGRLPGSKVRAGRTGTGLGLYLSRQLMEAMGGTLDLSTTGPDGSTFSLRLPVAEVSPAAHAEPALASDCSSAAATPCIAAQSA